MDDWKNALEQAPQRKARMSVSRTDCMERIDAEFRQKILKHQKKIKTGNGWAFEVDTTTEAEAMAYFVSHLFRKLILDILEKGYVIRDVSTCDDNDHGSPNANISIAVPR